MIDFFTYNIINAFLFLKVVASNFGATTSCSKGGDFLGLPHWYKYLGSEGTGTDCVPLINGLSDIWLIVLAVIEILLRIVTLAAIVYVIYGGIRFITSRGNPEKTTSARTALQDALIGLVISLVAIALVNFVGRKFQSK